MRDLPFFDLTTRESHVTRAFARVVAGPVSSPGSEPRTTDRVYRWRRVVDPIEPLADVAAAAYAHPTRKGRRDASRKSRERGFAQGRDGVTRFDGRECCGKYLTSQFAQMLRDRQWLRDPARGSDTVLCGACATPWEGPLCGACGCATRRNDEFTCLGCMAVYVLDLTEERRRGP